MTLDSLSIPSLGPAKADPGLSGVSATASVRRIDPDARDRSNRQQEAKPKRDSEASAQELDTARSVLERHFNSDSTRLQFRIDADSEQLVVSLIDSESGDVLRQIPSEEVLKLARALKSGGTQGGTVPLIEQRA